MDDSDFISTSPIASGHTKAVWLQLNQVAVVPPELPIQRIHQFIHTLISRIALGFIVTPIQSFLPSLQCSASYHPDTARCPEPKCKCSSSITNVYTTSEIQPLHCGLLVPLGQVYFVQNLFTPWCPCAQYVSTGLVRRSASCGTSHHI